MIRRLPASSQPLAVLALALVAGAACKPWTVRPIEGTARDVSAASGRFDAAAYADSIWVTPVVPTARSSATELLPGATAAAAPAGSTMLVRGEGTVVGVDAQSRVGLALVDLAPGDGRPDVALQVGPVLRGTAVRDAMPFIRFGDFANQLEFADVSNALNERVLRSVLRGVDVASLDGRVLSFWGAMKADGVGPGRLPAVVPIILEGGVP